MKKFIIGIPTVPLVLALLMVATPIFAARPGFVFPGSCCFYNGVAVRTVVPPSAMPNDGVDNFYAVTGGAMGQKAVVAVAPGNTNYHGGHWAFHSVTWNIAPYLLTSEASILAAQAADPPKIDPFYLEQRIHELVNIERTRQKVQPLKLDNKLGEIARHHSRDMADRGFQITDDGLGL